MSLSSSPARRRSSVQARFAAGSRLRLCRLTLACMPPGYCSSHFLDGLGSSRRTLAPCSCVSTATPCVVRGRLTARLRLKPRRFQWVLPVEPTVHDGGSARTPVDEDACLPVFPVFPRRSRRSRCLERRRHPARAPRTLHEPHELRGDGMAPRTEQHAVRASSTRPRPGRTARAMKG